MPRRWAPYSSATEPNMRQEMINFLDGSFPEIAKGQTALIRKMRRPLTECSCVDTLTGECDKDTACPFCQNEGHYWDESFITLYSVILGSDVSSAVPPMMQPGIVDPTLIIFYTKYSLDITPEDRIVTLVLDASGEPSRPYQRRALYRIGTAIDFRSDFGKLEYYKLICFEDKRKFLNGIE